MADPFVAEIRIVGFNFAPRGWATCDGQLLPISQNTALFSLLGTNYGGNGVSNFALPNLQGSTPMFFGHGPGLSSRQIGESGGNAGVTLQESEIPAHAHGLQGTTQAGNSGSPAGLAFAPTGRGRPAPYSTAATDTAMGPAVGPSGGSQPHNNRSPYLAMMFVIALQGVYPPRG
jgi:microcystin-dependent protein